LAKSEVDRVPKKDTSKKTTTVVVSAAPAKKAGDQSSQKVVILKIKCSLIKIALISFRHIHKMKIPNSILKR